MLHNLDYFWVQAQVFWGAASRNHKAVVVGHLDVIEIVVEHEVMSPGSEKTKKKKIVKFQLY
jgi:hypothetical protein